MAEDMRVGFGTADITPPLGVELCGFGWYLGRRSTGIIEPLLARAMVWQAGETRGAIISCDLVGVRREIVRDVRAMVSAECGIPADHIVVCATHTHSGPTTVGFIGWGEKDPDYLVGLPERIAGAAQDAAKQMAPATLEYGEVPVDGISFNREYRGGETDPLLKVLKVKSGDTLMGFLANYSCHPVVMCAETFLISGDFVGLATNALGAQYGAVGLFLQGSAGDQNSVYRFQPQEEAIQSLHTLADRFAERIEAAFVEAQPVEVDQVCVGRREITLPQVVPDRSLILRSLLLAEEVLKHQDLPEGIRRRFVFEQAVHEAVWKRYDRRPLDGRPTEIQAARFGPVVLVTHPAELFYGFHRETIERLAPLNAMVVGYANDYVGYVPSPDRFDVSARVYSYPAYFVPFLLGDFPFREDVGAVLRDAMVEHARSCV